VKGAKTEFLKGNADFFSSLPPFKGSQNEKKSEGKLKERKN